jgi:hypothetical protein
MTDETPASATQPPQAESTTRYTIDYVKSNFFRVVHADGVWGTITPMGDIHVDFWNVRSPIPRRLTNEVHANGEVETVGAEFRSDWVNEVEVGVVMSVETARSLRDWLTTQLADLDRPSSAPDS